MNSLILTAQTAELMIPPLIILIGALELLLAATHQYVNKKVIWMIVGILFLIIAMLAIVQELALISVVLALITGIVLIGL